MAYEYDAYPAEQYEAGGWEEEEGGRPATAGAGGFSAHHDGVVLSHEVGRRPWERITPDERTARKQRRKNRRR